MIKLNCPNCYSENIINRHTNITSYSTCKSCGYLFNFNKFNKKEIDWISIIGWSVLVLGILLVLYIFIFQTGGFIK